ncbi:hypothetical protein Btru_006916 [Bulinus truncatus]|nr:hypothetical protein Btru_006916 [Bulinus truncatus]
MEVVTNGWLQGMLHGADHLPQVTPIIHSLWSQQCHTAVQSLSNVIRLYKVSAMSYACTKYQQCHTAVQSLSSVIRLYKVSVVSYACTKYQQCPTAVHRFRCTYIIPVLTGVGVVAVAGVDVVAVAGVRVVAAADVSIVAATGVMTAAGGVAVAFGIVAAMYTEQPKSLSRSCTQNSPSHSPGAVHRTAQVILQELYIEQPKSFSRITAT